jgi:predicted RNase H-like nuclease (RuvC/YqgF family)
MDEEIKHLRKQLDDEKVRVQNLTERLRLTEHQLAIERT